jgi:RecJ-like exonuclease
MPSKMKLGRKPPFQISDLFKEDTVCPYCKGTGEIGFVVKRQCTVCSGAGRSSQLQNEAYAKRKQEEGGFVVQNRIRQNNNQQIQQQMQRTRNMNNRRR